MAKQVSKKSAKTAKAAATDAEGKKKKKRAHKRVETYASYIYKVLKQVHPGECSGGGPASAGTASGRHIRISSSLPRVRRALTPRSRRPRAMQRSA